MRNHTYEIHETSSKKNRHFHAFFVNDDTGLKTAWLHGRYDEKAEVLTFFIFDTVNRDSAQIFFDTRTLLILDTVNHYGTGLYKGAYVKEFMGAQGNDLAYYLEAENSAKPEARKDVEIFQTYDWANDKLPNLWLLEADALIDFYHLGATQEAVYKARTRSFVSPLAARKHMYAKMSGYKESQFRNRIHVRNIQGDIINYASEGSMNVHRTDFVELNTPIDDYGLLLHLTLETIQEYNHLGAKKLVQTMEWDEKRQRILHSVLATLSSLNLKDSESTKAINHEMDGKTLMGIIEETEEFPSQEFFRKVILDIAEKSPENYKY